MAAAQQTQLQTREDALAEYTDGETSPPICHLLGLPPELRLLIYEAYFGSTKMRKLYLRWGQKVELWYDQRTNGYNPDMAALLRTCKRIHDEALLVHDTSNVPLLVYGRWTFRDGGTSIMLDEDQLHFLKQVPTIKANFLGFNPSSVVKSMQEVCELIGWGKDTRNIVFTTPYLTANLWTREENGQLARVVAKLQCPSSIEGMRRTSWGGVQNS
ncbi:hypothetical protein LTR56_018009 [Elasticomyces elasticus]|nr:hypothetical protein LTR56_018009 [Elasticomyces elasticus]KAK3663344.1 hypothetical protein LTR22_005751 [Elasticomyces elasticus]KAK4925423.1 hypothetical protein LTR49_007487 [Elasticomyces elasticus]KAK5764518.1 hypothetical protein LTS12_005248 [Elasticomyces elasticus]